jgi:hypothetical protein
MAANLKRCECCHGTKRKLGMGGLVKKCDECNGIGWIDPVLATQEPDYAPGIVPTPAKRKGRPPKQVEIHV